jgi:hypothetical protein
MNSHVKKLVCYVIIVSKLKMNLLYDNLYTSYIHMESTIFDFFRSCIKVACGNYFRIVVNVPLKQQLCYN